MTDCQKLLNDAEPQLSRWLKSELEFKKNSAEKQDATEEVRSTLGSHDVFPFLLCTNYAYYVVTNLHGVLELVKLKGEIRVMHI